MENKKQIFTEGNQKQTVKFTINYNEENPIAVSDFTKALEGLNQMYASYVQRKLNSEEFKDLREELLPKVWKNALEKKGKEWERALREEWSLRSEFVEGNEEYFKNKWAEEHLCTFYIEEIKQGSIIGVLSSAIAGFVDFVEFVGSIASIVSLIKGEKKNETNNSNNVYNINGDHNIINNITNTYNIINVIQSPGQSIKIEDAQNRDIVEIDYHNVIRMKKWGLHRYYRYLHHPFFRYDLHCETTTFRKVWIQIEKRHHGEYYASVLNNPIIQNLRLPIDIRDELLKNDLEHDINNHIYLVDIDLIHIPHCRLDCMKFALYYVYRRMPLDYLIDGIRRDFY